jgi:protein arginine N-methyltransferase 7
MLLAKNPKIVPYRATTYGQLVESTFLWKLHDLHNNEANAADGVWLTPGEMERIVSVKPQQHAMQCDALEDEIRLVWTLVLQNLVEKYCPNSQVLICLNVAVRTLQSF